METYNIVVEPSRRPDSPREVEMVMISKGNPRHGEYLTDKQYHVTVVYKDGRCDPGRTLHVKRNEEECFCELDHPEGGSKRLSEEELSDLSFIFMPHR